MQRTLTLAFVLAITASVPALAAGYSQGPVAATAASHACARERSDAVPAATRGAAGAAATA